MRYKIHVLYRKDTQWHIFDCSVKVKDFSSNFPEKIGHDFSLNALYNLEIKSQKHF